MLTGESRFHISTPLGIWTWVPCDRKQTGSPLDPWDMVRMKWDCRLSKGLPPSSRLGPLDPWDMVRMKWDCRLSTGLPPCSRLRRLRSWKEEQQRAWNRDRKAVWDQVGLSHCRYEGLVMVWDKAHLRQGHRNYQSCQGHQCSETTLTGESQVSHKYPPGEAYR